MFDRISVLLKKEFIQIFRDPRMRPLIFVAPIIQMIIFGYIMNLEVKNIDFGILDLDRTYESRNLLQTFTGSPYFNLKIYAKDEKELENGLMSGDISLGIKIKSGFQAGLKKGNTVEVQSLVDGSISNIASVTINYASQTLNIYNTRILKERFEQKAGLINENLRAKFPVLGSSGLDVRIRALYNPDLESRNYYVPCVIANLVLIITLLLTSMAIVREKEIGTMEQLIVTPIKPYELIIGKTIPFALIGLFDTGFTLLIGVLWFNVPLNGSILLLFAGSVLFILGTLSMGLLVSIVSNTQQQAMMTTFLIMFPAVLLSGFMFPIENMPDFFQYITYLNPLRYFIIVLRGIFLKGTGFSILWPQFLGLFIIGTVLFLVSVNKFSKKLG